MMKVTKEELLEIMAAKDALSGIESLDNPERTETAKDGGSLMNLDFTEGGGHPGEPFDMIFLKSIIGSLPEKERQIIVLRYFKDMTQAPDSRKTWNFASAGFEDRKKGTL